MTAFASLDRDYDERQRRWQKSKEGPTLNVEGWGTRKGNGGDFSAALRGP
jgi:hypothetical protein